jgi:hypothetical protein
MPCRRRSGDYVIDAVFTGGTARFFRLSDSPPGAFRESFPWPALPTAGDYSRDSRLTRNRALLTELGVPAGWRTTKISPPAGLGICKIGGGEARSRFRIGDNLPGTKRRPADALQKSRISRMRKWPGNLCRIVVAKTNPLISIRF